MGFISKGYDLNLNAYLTQKGREILLSGNRDETIAKYFILGDSDRNYNLMSDDRIKELMIPDLTGDKSDSIYSLADGIDIRHKVGTFKDVANSIGFQRTLTYVPTPELNGSELKMVNTSRIEDIHDENKTLFGNLYTSLNLPCTEEQKNEFAYGQYSTTALQYLNQDNVLIIEIPKNSYGEIIDGKSIKLQLEVENSEIIDIYSTFFEHDLVKNNGNSLYSDPNQFSSNFGTLYKEGTLAGQHGMANPLNGYSSNVAYLFSDYIRKPRNDNNKTWASNGSYFKDQPNVPSGKLADKEYAKYNGVNMDYPVGIAYLDKGFIVITNQTIINNLSSDRIDVGVEGTEIPNTSNYVLKQFYINSSSLDFSSFNTEFIQHSVCICLPNEFYTTENPTYDKTTERPVAITEIGLYNSAYELIAIGKPSYPIAKDKFSVLTFNMDIRV